MMKMILMNKYLWISLIIVGINIPLSMIEGQIEERASQRSVAKQAVAKSWTGEQKLLVGLLVIPYEQKSSLRSVSGYQEQTGEKIQWLEKKLFILADTLSVQSQLSNQSLKKGLYSVPVYTAELNIEGRLNLDKLAALKANPDIRVSREPYLSIGVSDSRGLVGLPEIFMGDSKLRVEPGSQLNFYPGGFSAPIDKETLALNGAEKSQQNAQEFHFSVKFKLNGMQKLTFISAAKDSQISAHSDWPHPEFTGAFLPVSRQISDQGYSANWQTGLFSTNINSVMELCSQGDCADISQNAFGVGHVQPVDIYLQSLRSIKYGLLIVLVTFCIFTLYEILNEQIKIHPISYLLTGVALAIFFLLLVALSEHIAFAVAYWAASFACSGLIGFYVASQSGERRIGFLMLLILQLLYLILFLIIRSEDHALLSGSLLLFVLLATVMWVTRKINWYEIGKRGSGLGSRV
jgi:inner membrane protein